MDFLEQVKIQLTHMSETEKDTWILTQAKLMPERKHQDFLLSLSGEKKIINMPSLDDIEIFFKQIENGDIYFEYVTHYYEFDDEGNYLDDWEYWFKDPFSITNQLEAIIAGCHQLLSLEEYQLVFDLLRKVFALKFRVEEGETSEDSPEYEYISLLELDEKSMFSCDLSDAAEDWIISCMYVTKDRDQNFRANKLIEVLCNPICKKLKPSNLVNYGASQELFFTMAIILEKELTDLESLMKNLPEEMSNSLERHNLTLAIERKRELLSDIQMNCMNVEKSEDKQIGWTLTEAWEDIRELDFMLKCEPYIDDQPQMDDIHEICEDIIHFPSLAKEDWALRKSIIEEIIENDYYDSYGCNDEMEELAEKLCTNQEEFLYYADLLYATDWYREKGADIYLRYDQDDKYLSYLNRHDVKKNKAYHTLMKYYQEHDQEEKACEVALLGLENCKDCDVTEMMLLLLLNAKKQGDQKQFNKFLQSARRRKNVDMEKINKELQNI